jgi:4-amino-4-deoxy-L-arabinose transferase-like glycosyltransferase
LLRLAFAGAIGLGIDESYMVAAGRHLRLGYFDHPPLSWWLSWGATQLLGSDGEIAVRLPFILLFALSTWLMYRLGETLFAPSAGLWAAVALNLAPVFGVTTASWVLPDGPLDAALLGLALCLVNALRSADRRWWIGVGVCAGIALLSKYTAVLTLAGFGLYLLTQPRDRRWLRCAEPYIAGLIALALFAPVLAWNAWHGWISFAFQGSRAVGLGLHLWAPFATLGGEALFLLPWLWLGLMLVLAQALRQGPAQPGPWLLCCLGIVPIAAFSLVALWSEKRILFHWAAPGYLMLFPLLGEAIAARLTAGGRAVRAGLIGTAALVTAGTGFVASEVRWNWLPDFGGSLASGANPALDAVDWTSLRDELAQRGLLDGDPPAVAVLRWTDAGKLDYALGGTAPVICLCADPREYGLIGDGARYRGHDLLVVAPRMTAAEIAAGAGTLFASFEPLPALTLMHAGKAALSVPLFLGRDLLRLPLQP